MVRVGVGRSADSCPLCFSTTAQINRNLEDESLAVLDRRTHDDVAGFIAMDRVEERRALFAARVFEGELASKRSRAKWGPVDPEGRPHAGGITLATTEEWAMRRGDDELFNDKSRAGAQVWREVLQHRISLLPAVAPPFGGVEEEDVLVAVEEVPVAGANADGGFAIRGRLLTDVWGRTRSSVAKCAMVGNLAGLEMELRAHGDPECVDERGNSALTLAALHGQVEAIRMLARYGADLYFQDQKGWSAAHGAVIGRGGSPGVLALLYTLGAPVDLPDKTGSVPAHHAATLNKLDCLKVLALIAPHTLSARASNGFTPLHRAAQAGSHRAVELLLRVGVDKDAVDCMRETAAHKAARLSNGEAFDILRLFGAAVRVPNKDDDTAACLHFDHSLPFMSADDDTAVSLAGDPAKSPSALLHEQQLTLRRKQAFAARDAMNAVAMRAEVRAKIHDEAVGYRASRMLVGVRYEMRTGLEAEQKRKREAREAREARQQKLLEARRLQLVQATKRHDRKAKLAAKASRK